MTCEYTLNYREYISRVRAYTCVTPRPLIPKIIVRDVPPRRDDLARYNLRMSSLKREYMILERASGRYCGLTCCQTLLSTIKRI